MEWRNFTFFGLFEQQIDVIVSSRLTGNHQWSEASRLRLIRTYTTVKMETVRIT